MINEYLTIFVSINCSAAKLLLISIIRLNCTRKKKRINPPPKQINFIENKYIHVYIDLYSFQLGYCSAIKIMYFNSDQSEHAGIK